MLQPEDAALVRRDAELPGLATLLDPQAFGDALCRHLHGLELDGVRAVYVRYKPGTNCLVAYQLLVGGAEVAAYAKAYQPGAHDKLGNAMKKPSVSPSPPLNEYPGRFVLADKAVVVSLFPNDRGLKALSEQAGADAWRALLHSTFPGRPDLREGSVRGIRYKPERRYVAQVLTEAGPRAAIKVYSRLGFPAAERNARAFQSRGALRVPALLGHSGHHRALAFEWLPGRLLEDIIPAPDVPLEDLARTGAALAELHAQDPTPLAVKSRESEASALISLAAGLSFLCPHLAARLQRLGGRLAAQLRHEAPVGCAIHGDFYAGQVLVCGDRVAIIDLDEAARGDPAADLGLFVAHLERDALRGTLPPGRVPPLRDALIGGYAAATLRPAPQRVALYTAAGLLSLAPEAFRQRQHNWPQLTEAIIARAEALFQEANPTILDLPPAPSPNSKLQTPKSTGPDVQVVDPFGVAGDEAMPFMARALNPRDVCLLFEQRSPGLLDHSGHGRLKAIRVVRHKPGRRCLVEYDLEVERPDGPPERVTLVGKARARGLDKQTYGVIEALWRSGFDTASADGISVPEPVGMLPEFQMWLYCKVEGVPATRLLPGPGGTELAGRVAEAIHKLHRVGVHPARRHTIADELDILHQRLPLVAVANPQWQTRIERLLAACDRLGAGLPEPICAGIHRDFYADQVIVDGERLYLLDFDLYCEGDPALDVGNFLGHLIEQGLRTLGDPAALIACQTALEDRFVQLAGESTRPAVEGYATLTLARHVHLSTQFPERRPFTEALLDLCEQRLRVPIGSAT